MESALVGRSLDNDTRGWIMCIVSGIACVFGAAIICVDSLVRLFPGMRNFRIQDSNAFLAASLSLSFGVMLYSSLHSMLPEAENNIKDAGWDKQSATLLANGCLIAGFGGIQVISRILHQFMPSHVVDCDHSHQESVASDDHSNPHSRRQSRASRSRRRSSRPSQQKQTPTAHQHHDAVTEDTPLLQTAENGHAAGLKRHASARDGEMMQRPTNPVVASRARASTGGADLDARRPSIFRVPKRVLSFVKDTKCECDEQGSCYGYTDPCGQECFKHVASRGQTGSRQPTLLRTTTGPMYPQTGSVFHGGQAERHADANDQPQSPRFRTSRAASREPLDPTVEEAGEEISEDHHDETCSSEDDADLEAQHHHHVSDNAFLSLGLQTSIAIALHKFPEGFITYATNHANPSLGFNVFVALFVHNISEGFAMCLPLYMALGSRWRAMAWAALLGGLSQPFGAAIAVLWFHLADKTHMAPNAVAYGCLFAITAGIMVSVALQLFMEAISLNHNRNMCLFWGFLGMAGLGLSNAFISGH
jgi:ZIP family zinc transporter